MSESVKGVGVGVGVGVGGTISKRPRHPHPHLDPYSQSHPHVRERAHAHGRENLRPETRADSHMHEHSMRSRTRTEGRDGKHRSSSSRRASRRDAKQKCKDGSLTRSQAKRIEASRGEPTYVLGANGRFRENPPGPDIDVTHSTVDIASAVEVAIAQLQAGMANAMNSNLCDADNVLINKEYFDKQAELEQKRKEKAIKDGEARASVTAHDFYSQLLDPNRPRATPAPTTAAATATVAAATAPATDSARAGISVDEIFANVSKQSANPSSIINRTKPPTNPTPTTTSAAQSVGNFSNLNLRPAPTISKPRAAPSISSILARGPPRASRNNASATAALRRMTQPVPPAGFKRLSLDPRRLARLSALSLRPNTTTNTNRNTSGMGTGRLQLSASRPGTGGQSTIRINPKSAAGTAAVARANARPTITIGRNTNTNANANANALANTHARVQRPTPSLTKTLSAARTRKELPTTIDLTGDDDEVVVSDVNVNTSVVRPSNPRTSIRRANHINRPVARSVTSSSTSTQMHRSFKKRRSTDPVLLAVPIPRKKRKPSGD